MLKKIFKNLLKWRKNLITFHNIETNNDKWVLSVLNGKKKGYFIEAGAWDGIKSSATYVLEKYFGWRGILIEPGPAFSDLKKNRPRSICVNKILSDKKSIEEFISFPNHNYGYSCTKDNFIKHKARILRACGNKDKLTFEQTDVETIRLVDLLKKYDAPKVIDFFSLDIEGSELKVLKTFPFDKYKIRCISVEGHECDELLISKGYRKVNNKYNLDAPWESYFIYELE